MALTMVTLYQGSAPKMYRLAGIANACIGSSFMDRRACRLNHHYRLPENGCQVYAPVKGYLGRKYVRLPVRVVAIPSVNGYNNMVVLGSIPERGECG